MSVMGAIYKRHPKVGTVWRKRTGKRVETRHVMDRTLGGDVLYVSGRWYRGAFKIQCTLDEWNSWDEGKALLVRRDFGTD